MSSEVTLLKYFELLMDSTDEKADGWGLKGHFSRPSSSRIQIQKQVMFDSAGKRAVFRSYRF